MGLFGSRSRKSGGKEKHKRDSPFPTIDAQSAAARAQSPEPTTEPRMSQNHPNTSSSNLSTSSTLRDTPHTPRETTLSSLSTCPTSYEAFVQDSRESEQRRKAKDEQMQKAWKVAAERRRQNELWPQDPWRGGFGPPGSGRHSRCGEGTMTPRREGSTGIQGWLKQNSLSRH